MWQIGLKTGNNFTSYLDSDEDRAMHSKSDSYHYQ